MMMKALMPCSNVVGAVVFAGALLCVSSVLCVSSAFAGDADSRAQADRLFRDARGMLDQGRYQEACRLFERSLELEPSPGTLLNLGNCHEQSGSLARALATFERAIADAKLEPDAQKRTAWVEAGTRRRDSLAARVPLVRLTPSPTAGASVVLDGAAPVRVGEPLRLDAGRHEVEVGAPGYRTFRRELALEPGQVLALELPALEPIAAVAPPVEPALEAEPYGAGSSAARSSAAGSRGARGASLGPWVLLGSGIALGAGGTVTALLAQSKENRLENGCGAGPVCADASLRSVRDSGESLALATYVLLGAGSLSAAAGLIWLALDAAPPAGSTELSAGCALGGCGVFAQGTF